MNKIYRLVWSDSRQAYVVTHECSSSGGRKSQTVGAVGALVGSLLFGACVYAQVVPATTVIPVAGTKTNAYISPNGVPVVNINTANTAGVSHNTYTSYNVESKGLVLNNGNNSVDARQSKLAGQVVSNVNLAKEATVILNEVVTANRSSLNGYTEVLGGKADVIIANPWGITCNGCGFINTDRVTLTTGVPIWAKTGMVNRFAVDQGDLLITGKGADATAQQVLDLVARSIKLDGQVNLPDSGELSMVSGNNTWSYATRNVTSTQSPTSSAPSYAIDSTQLGGAYAGRIRIVATEAGVGVRMLGEVAANRDDFVLTSTGQVELRNKISAQRDVSVEYNGGAFKGVTALSINGTDSEISAKRDILVAVANDASTVLGDTKLTAGQDLKLSSGTLSDEASRATTRFAARNAELKATQNVRLNQVTWGAGGKLSVDANSLAVQGQGATLYAGSDTKASDRSLAVQTHGGSLDLANASVTGAADVALTSDAGAITLGKDGSVKAASQLTVTAASAVTNAGQMLAAKQLTVQASDASVDLKNTGTLQSGGTVQLGVTGHNVGTLNNSTSDAKVLAGKLNVMATDISNAGRMQATQSSSVKANTFANTGNYLGSTQKGGDASLDLAQTFENSGKVQSAGTLSVVAKGALQNAGTVSTLSQDQGGSDGKLTLQGSSLFNAGLVDSAQDLAINTTSKSTGQKYALNNEGQLQSRAAMDLSVGDSFGNLGSVVSDGALNITSGVNGFVVANRGQLQASTALSIGDASAKVKLSNDDSDSMKQAEAQKKTTIQSGGTLNVQATEIYNERRLQSAGQATIVADSLNNAKEHAVVLLASAGDSAANITLSGTFKNVGALHSGASLTLNAKDVTNTNTGGISAGKTLTVKATAGKLQNDGALYAGENVTLSAVGKTVHNTQTGTIDTDGTLNIDAEDIVNNGSIVVKGDATIVATNSFTNETVLKDGKPITKTLGEAKEFGEEKKVAQIYDQSLVLGDGADITVWEQDFKRTETLSGSIPEKKAQIIVNGAGGTLDVSYGKKGSNTIAVLSAPTIKIGGDAQGTFTNQDLTLYEYTYTRRWIKNYDFWRPGLLGFREETRYWARTDKSRQGWDAVGKNNAFDYDEYKPGQGWSPATQSLDDVKSWATAGATRKEVKTLKEASSGIFGGNSLFFTKGNLNNIGNPYETDTDKASAGTAASSPTVKPSTKPKEGGATSPNAALPSNAVELAGLNLTLPNNPNGYFVISKTPKGRFLVETNSLFAVGSNYVGSDYLAQRYGYNPDTVQRRLGDANYEGYLIRQQLIALTGNNILKGQASESAQMKNLMDNAFAQTDKLGLKWGVPPTPQQLANLTDDIVWMETTKVNGEDVLVPKVYLSGKSKKSIVTGSVIAAAEVDIKAESVTASGGTIQGSGSLNIESTKDIVNESGTIAGGKVKLKSTEGSIESRTLATTEGDSTSQNTVIGKKATIQADTLDMDAKKDIKLIGADVEATQNAKVHAGGDVVVGTVVEKTSTSSTTSSVGFLSTSSTNTTHTTEKNLGSTIKIGTQATKDQRIADQKDLDLKMQDFKAARDQFMASKAEWDALPEDQQTAEKLEKVRGAFDAFKSSFNSAKAAKEKIDSNTDGNLSISTGSDTGPRTGSITLTGAKVDVAGNLDMKAGDISILAAIDKDVVDQVTRTTKLFDFSTKASDSNGGKSSAGTKTGQASGAAGASAKAQAGNSTEFNLVKVTVETDHKEDQTVVGTSIKVGGKTTLDAANNVLLEGASLDSEGDVALKGKNVTVKAAQAIDTETKSTETTKVGIYVDSKAEASAQASARGAAAGPLSGGNANASAKASAESTITLGARTNSSSESTVDVKNTKSSITSRGSVSVTATETALFEGASVDAEKNISIKAKDILNKAVQDTHTETQKESQTTAGVYLGGKAEANAQAKVASGGLGSNAKASGGVGVEVSAGLRIANESESTEKGTVTNQTNSFTARNGSITRTADNLILDQGTQLEAGQNITQTAKTLVDQAVSNEKWSKESSNAQDVRMGVYAGAKAEGNVGGQGKPGTGSGAKSGQMEASAGLKGSYTNEGESKTTSEKNAVTSSYKAGGAISSVTTESTTLEGTNFQAGGDVSLAAKSLDFKAATNTKVKTEGEHAGEVDAKLALVGAPGGELSGKYDQSSGKTVSNTAVTGSITSTGGNVTIKTTDALRLQGTSVEANNDVLLDSANGNVVLDAAKNTETQTGNSFNVSAELSGTATKPEGAIGGGLSRSSNETVTNTVSNIVSKNGSTTVKAGKDITSEGAKIDSAGPVNLNATGNVSLLEAKNTTRSSEFGVQGGMGASKQNVSGDLSLSAGQSDKQTGSATSIQSKSTVSVTAGNGNGTITSQQAQLQGGQPGAVTLEGKVKDTKLTNVDTGMDVQLDGSFSEKRGNSGKKPAATNPALAAAKGSAKQAESPQPTEREKTIADLKKSKADLDQKFAKTPGAKKQEATPAKPAAPAEKPSDTDSTDPMAALKGSATNTKAVTQAKAVERATTTAELKDFKKQTDKKATERARQKYEKSVGDKNAVTLGKPDVKQPLEVEPASPAVVEKTSRGVVKRPEIGVRVKPVEEIGLPTEKEVTDVQPVHKGAQNGIIVRASNEPFVAPTDGMPAPSEVFRAKKKSEVQ